MRNWIINHQIIVTAIIAVIFALAIIFSGCATVQPREYYLDAGEKVRVTSPTQLSVRVEKDGSFIIESKDYILGENLIIK